MSSISIKVGGKTIESSVQKQERLSMLLWGKSGCGKTTLAETAPGEILWINFDPDGTTSLQRHEHKPAIHVLDFSTEPDRVVEQFTDIRAGIMPKLGQILEEHPGIKTVVFDSLTTFGDKCLTHGVVKGLSTSKGKSEGISIEQPGYTGYGNKNTWVNQSARAMLELTKQHNKHVILVAHEDIPTKDKNGNVVGISLMLGSSLSEQVPVRISEVWNISDTGRERRIAVRPVRMRTPMRTRMFSTDEHPEFVWKYNADTDTGMRIEDWYNEWKGQEFKKIKLPK